MPGKNEPRGGHYQRLRERFLSADLEGFLDYEVLELLLKLADPRPDHKPTAKALLERFGTLGGVLEAPRDQLLEIKGVGEKNLFGLKLVQSVARRYLKDDIIGRDYATSATLVSDYLVHHLKNRNREQFLILLLNGRNQVIDLLKMFEGSLTTSAVYSREVIKAILTRDAAAVIFVHNHPSGNPSPSADDIQITKRLKAACLTIDVQVHDHIIVGGNELYSFAEHGIL